MVEYKCQKIRYHVFVEKTTLQKRLEKVDIRYENCTIVVFKEIWVRNTYIYTYDSYHYMEWLTRGYKKRDAHKVVGVYLQAYIIILSHIGIMRAQL